MHATAKRASDFWEYMFVPPVKETPVEFIPLPNLLCDTRLAMSRAQARRLVMDGAVKVNGEAKTSIVYEVEVRDGVVLQVGKHWVATRDQGKWKVEKV